MTPKKPNRIDPKLPRGFADRGPADIRAVEAMMQKIKAVYERYGFEPVETPFVEYTEALGKFLPDQDRPNEGVFSFQDEDESWLSLRYDLTASLARYVAQNYDALPKPYRSYRAGWVFRNEKPGPGRFRQFMQFDADTVGSASVAADAEICMMAADTMEAVGFERGQYVIKVNNRKVLDGVMEAIGLGGEENAGRRLTVLRAIDKIDRLGLVGVRHLLGPGRRDESGDFTRGAGLSDLQAARVIGFLQATIDLSKKITAQMYLSDVKDAEDRDYELFDQLLTHFSDSPVATTGVRELEECAAMVRVSGYDTDRIQFDPSIVRGLEYYTGPVFEAQLTFEVPNEKGEPVVFGSVGGGGRYDGLVGRFRGEEVPATGFSVGVSRLATALKAIGKLGDEGFSGPVVVTVMDKSRLADYQRIVADLRNAGVAAEMYLGTSGMKAQLKYADKRNSPAVIMQGEREIMNLDGTPRDPPMVQIKNLAVGKQQAAAIADHQAWREERPGQFEVAQGDLVAKVKELLARQKAG